MCVAGRSVYVLVLYIPCKGCAGASTSQCLSFFTQTLSCKPTSSPRLSQPIKSAPIPPIREQDPVQIKPHLHLLPSSRDIIQPTPHLNRIRLDTILCDNFRCPFIYFCAKDSIVRHGWKLFISEFECLFPFISISLSVECGTSQRRPTEKKRGVRVRYAEDNDSKERTNLAVKSIHQRRFKSNIPTQTLNLLRRR